MPKERATWNLRASPLPNPSNGRSDTQQSLRQRDQTLSESGSMSVHPSRVWSPLPDAALARRQLPASKTPLLEG